MRSLCTLATVVAALWAGSANALVIDFEEYELGAVNPPSGDSTSKGFVLDYFDPPGEPAGNPVISDFGGDKSYVNCPNCLAVEQVDIYTVNGDAFSLFAMDVGSAGSGVTFDYEITGFLDGGGIVSLSVQNVVAFQTINFDASWTGLTSFRIEIDNTANPSGIFGASAIDNIVVTPIPAAVWLFGSGLALLGWVRRPQGD